MVGKLTNDGHMSCSRLPALLGLSPWSSPNDELQKSYAALNGIAAKPWEGNEATRLGDTLEPIILRLMRQRLDMDTLIEPDAPFHAPPGIALSGSLDGVAGMIPVDRKKVIKTDPDQGIYVMTPSGEISLSGNGAFECKLTSNHAEDAPAPHRGPIQLQGQLLCSGFKWGAVGVLYQGIELRIFVFPRDEKMISTIMEAVEEFERRKRGPDYYVPANPADGIRTYARAETGAPPVDLDRAAIALCDELIAAKKLMKISERTIEETTSALMGLLGNHDIGVARDSDGTTWTVKWPTINFKATADKTTLGKPAYSIRRKTLGITVQSADGKTEGEA